MGSNGDRGAELTSVAARHTYARLVNASLADAQSYRLSDEFSVLCECGDSGCSEWITLTKAAYQAARSDSSSYIVALGHEIREHETVKRRYGTYTVVESRDPVRRPVAERLRPTSP
jgi:hypothetical protein